MSTRRLAESVEGLNNSLATGNFWPKKGVPICWRAVVKGLMQILCHFADSTHPSNCINAVVFNVQTTAQWSQ